MPYFFKCWIALVCFISIHATVLTGANARAAAEDTPSFNAKSARGGARFIQTLESGGKVRIATMGTSLTGGRWRWVDVMKTWLDKDYPGQVTVLNFGVGASASERYLKGRSGLDLLPKVIVANPDVVFIEFAINDAHVPYRISQESSKANLITMINSLRQANPKTEVIVQTMNAVTGRGAADRPKLAAYFQGYREVARKHRAQLIDHYPNWLRLLREDPKRFAELVPDGVHPQEPGLREIMLPTLKAELRKDCTAAMEIHRRPNIVMIMGDDHPES